MSTFATRLKAYRARRAEAHVIVHGVTCRRGGSAHRDVKQVYLPANER
jgi:hypothetical protein